MTAPEINDQVVARVKPILDELGFEGFVLCGYIVTEEGVTRSFVCDGKKNPMVQDALMPLIGAGMHWARVRQPPGE